MTSLLERNGKSQHLAVSSSFYTNALAILDSMCYLEKVTFSNSYKQAVVALLDAAKREKSDLLVKRGDLENALDENTAAIQEIEQQIEQLEDLALRGIVVETTNDRPLAKETSFSRAIAFVLKGASRPLSPVDIRDRLSELGYNASEWKTDVVSSVHTVLKRFLAANPPKVTETGEPRRKVYQWNWDAGRTLESDSGVGDEKA